MEITQKIETGNREAFAQKQLAFCQILADQKLNPPIQTSSLHINERKIQKKYHTLLNSWPCGLRGFHVTRVF